MVTVPVLRFSWHTPAPLLAGMGFAATIRHYILIRAYQYAPAPLWQCSAYSRSSRRRFLGWLFSGTFEVPLPWTGAVVIVAGGNYIGFRERKTDAAESGCVLGSDQSA